MNLSGKKILMIIAPANFRDEEFSVPKQVFLDNKIDVTVASTVGTATGMHGMKVDVNKSLDEINVNNYDAIVFVGGSGAQTYFNNSKALSIARESYEKGKITAAICIAPVILANAGVLDGKKATVWDGQFRTMLEAKNAVFISENVVKDGNIITANGPDAANQFAETILHALK